MDLVNSVTQNSNNRNVTMENQCDGPSGADNGGNGDDRHRKSANQDNSMQQDAGDSGPQAALQVDQQPQRQQLIKSNSDTKHVPDYLKAIGMDPRKFWPKKYRFTREKSPGQHNPLSIAQRNFYEANGYLIIDDCVSSKLLQAMRSQYNQSALVDEFLLDKLVARSGKLLQFVKCFCDDKVMLMTHQLVDTFQSPEAAKALIDQKLGARQLLFRDWIYLPFRPIDKVVCAITAIEPIEHVLLVVPGTHRVGQCSISSTLETISAAYDTSQDRNCQQNAIARELFECNPESLSSLVEKSKKGFRYINLKAGQTFFYHPGLVHGFSDDLVNFRKRQLASIAYYAAADCEYIDLRKSLDLVSAKQSVPLSLSHFKEKNPSDYHSWLDKPKLLKDRAAL